ncbi:NUDIX hydrolase [Acanthamoeba polyphaga moumouvirus]|uniref:NUDIX hydrolase n=1 Tax=Acanthamoeba polyphaga moumouvirus TaxID=1269028 RepID=L7RBY5_9VIRU|nr:NUDIX hydrolase [Acanthamoeba polyphaga moumouvirus]AGC01681.1 NUDIX hydrolase [Acanthamoeba polyphaga moumouvirus]AQN68019.1 NUDIx hydrolase [Saudi moumouvirus]
MICGAALMDRDNRLCIVKEKKSGLWGLPKGRKSSEDITAYACACRKIRQELLLDVEDEEFNCCEMQGIKSGKYTIFIMKTDIVYTKIDTRISKNLSEIHWIPLNFILSDSLINPSKYNKMMHIFRDIYLEKIDYFINVIFRNGKRYETSIVNQLKN